MTGNRKQVIGECAGCRKPLTESMSHRYQGMKWCEDCAMEVRKAGGRKTHWQYLKSIKTDYLRPGSRIAPEKTRRPKKTEQGED